MSINSVQSGRNLLWSECSRDTWPVTRYILLLALFLLTGCAASVLPSSGHIEGDSDTYFGHEVRSWARADEEGVLSEIGITLPRAVVEATPTILPAGSAPGFHDATWSVRLALPRSVRQETVFDHVDIDFVPGGHPPSGVYDVPHFDVHFYAIGVDKQLAIDCSDFDPVSPDLLPPFYIATRPGLPPQGECAPVMGHHAFDLRSPELAPQPAPFSASMVLGYYTGAFTFLEPMLSRAFFIEKQQVELEVPVPPMLGQTTRYPTRFRAVYDEQADAYNLILTDFVQVIAL